MQEGRDAERKAVVYERTDDLLALQQELLGPVPLMLARRGRNFQRYMTEEGQLRRIPSLKFWALEEVLEDKYCVPRKEAKEIAAFLLPMLRYDPEERASAAEMLQHPWLLKHCT
jgi:serine/threonine-protein kinase SRPK3